MRCALDALSRASINVTSDRCSVMKQRAAAGGARSVSFFFQPTSSTLRWRQRRLSTHPICRRPRRDRRPTAATQPLIGSARMHGQSVIAVSPLRRFGIGSAEHRKDIHVENCPGEFAPYFYCCLNSVFSRPY